VQGHALPARRRDEVEIGENATSPQVYDASNVRDGGQAARRTRGNAPSSCADKSDELACTNDRRLRLGSLSLSMSAAARGEAIVSKCCDKFLVG